MAKMKDDVAADTAVETETAGLANLWYAQPEQVHFNPANPRAVTFGLTPDGINAISDRTARKGFDPGMLPHLPDLKPLAMSLFSSSDEGLIFSPLAARNIDGRVVVVDGDRRLAASRMIAQGFHAGSQKIHNPAWKITYLLVDEVAEPAPEDVAALSVMLNGAAEMTPPQYFAYVSAVCERMIKAGHTREDIVQTIISHTSKSESWADHMVRVYEAPSRVHELFLGGTIGFKAARNLAFQPERVIGKVIETGNFDNGEAWSEPMVRAKIRDVREELGQDVNAPLDDDISDAEEQPAEATATATQAPGKKKKIKTGKRTMKNTAGATTPRLSMKELIDLCKEQGGFGEVAGKEKDPSMLDFYASLRMFCEGELKRETFTKRMRKLLAGSGSDSGKSKSKDEK